MAPPSLHPLHPLGTDETGRDIFSLLVYRHPDLADRRRRRGHGLGRHRRLRRHHRRLLRRLDRQHPDRDRRLVPGDPVPAAGDRAGVAARAAGGELARRQAGDHHHRHRDHRLGGHVADHPQPGAVDQGAHVRRAVTGAGRPDAVGAAQADPAQRAAADLRQHGADHRHLDPVRVDALVPRPGRPQQAVLGNDARHGERVWRRGAGIMVVLRPAGDLHLPACDGVHDGRLRDRGAHQPALRERR